MVKASANGFLGGNCRWTVRIGEKRNENYLRIHDQSMGRTIFESDEVWDTDALKLVRILIKYEYNHRVNLNEAIAVVNRELRHIKLYPLKNEYGGLEEIIDLGDG